MIAVVEAFRFDVLTTFLAASCLGGIIIGLYLYQYKETPGTKYLALMQFGTAAYALFYYLEYSSPDLSERLFWSKLSYIGIILTPVFFYLFSLRFVNRKKPVSLKIKLPVYSISALLFTFVLTNNYHHLHWESAYIDQTNNTTIYHYGPVFWIIFISIYIILMLAIANIMKLIRQVSGQMYAPGWLLLLGSIFPITGNILYVFKINPVPGFDWTPVCFLFSGAMLSYINIRFNAFDLIPMARKTIVDIMEDGVLITDQQNRIADINKSMLRLVRKKKKELIGKELTSLFPERKSLLEEITHTQKTMQMEISSNLNPGDYYLEIRVSPLWDKNGFFSGRIFVFSDITHRKKVEANIIQSNKNLKKEIREKEKLINDLNAFAHTVAHDLRDTIGSIVSTSDLINYDLDHEDYSSIAGLNEIIYTSATKTLYIIKELLTLSTVREQDIKREFIDMGKVINESEKRLKELIEQTGARIIKPGRWPVVKGNPIWLEEVWFNYMANAIKYGGEPPVIELGAEQLYTRNMVKFWVKDNGKGLTETEQKKLFSQFTRLETLKVEGTGLGLSIVKRIVEKLGGKVGIFSNAIPGKGSIFYFTLPG